MAAINLTAKCLDRVAEHPLCELEVYRALLLRAVGPPFEVQQKVEPGPGAGQALYLQLVLLAQPRPVPALRPERVATWLQKPPVLTDNRSLSWHRGLSWVWLAC